MSYKRELQMILLGHKEILPGLAWLGRHLEKFPNGQLPEQRLEVSVDGKRCFTVTTKIKSGAIEEAMNGLSCLPLAMAPGLLDKVLR